MFVFLKHDNCYKIQSWNVFVALRAVWWELLLQIWKERNKALVQCLIYNQKGERNLLSFPMEATSTWGKRGMLPKNSSQANDHVALLTAVQALGSTSCCGFKWGWKLVLEVIQWCYIVRPYLLIFFPEFFKNSMYYILIILPLSQLLPEPPVCFHSHWTWCPDFLFVCLLPPIKSNLCGSYTLPHVGIHWNTVNLPWATSLKKMDSTFPSNCQLLIAPQLGVGLHAHAHPPCWDFVWLVCMGLVHALQLLWVCTASNLLCLENIVLLEISTISGSSDLSTPSSTRILSLGRAGSGIDVPCSFECSSLILCFLTISGSLCKLKSTTKIDSSPVRSFRDTLTYEL